MNILITGCMGFIGSNLVGSVLNSGHNVIGFDNLTNASINPTDRMKYMAGENWKNFKFYKVDITHAQQMMSILANESIDLVIHLAAVGSVPRSFSTPVATVCSNELGFVTMLNVAGAIGVKRFVFASSSSVYGDNGKDIKTEGEEGPVTSPYALSKRMNEEFARLWCNQAKMNYVGLRFFNVYGPGQRPDSIYSAVIPKFINSNEITIYGDGETTRDFTFVSDVVRAIGAASEYTKDGSTIVNVGKGNGSTINELAKLLKKDKIVYKPNRVGDVKVSIANPDKAEEELNFVAQTSIEEGLEITKEFYEQTKGVVHGLR